MYCTLVLLVFSCAVFSQSSMVTTGGEASGLGGSASFSVGQIVYHVIPDETFSVHEGVQQPFEVVVLSVPEMTENYLFTTVYPNPVVAGLTVQFESLPEDSDYELYDIGGRLIQTERISNLSTVVPMDGFRAGVYILHITKALKTVQSFKIIKN